MTPDLNVFKLEWTVHVSPVCLGLLCSFILMMLLVDGDTDADGGNGDAAAGGHFRRRDCNIGQCLHSCFKLDLLKSFRRAMSTRAKLERQIYFLSHSHIPSFSFIRYIAEMHIRHTCPRMWFFLIFLMIIYTNLSNSPLSCYSRSILFDTACVNFNINDISVEIIIT